MYSLQSLFTIIFSLVVWSRPVSERGSLCLLGLVTSVLLLVRRMLHQLNKFLQAVWNLADYITGLKEVIQRTAPSTVRVGVMGSGMDQSTAGAVSTGVEDGGSPKIAIGELASGLRPAGTRENLPEVIIDVISLGKNKLKTEQKKEFPREENRKEVEEARTGEVVCKVGDMSIADK